MEKKLKQIQISIKAYNVLKKIKDSTKIPLIYLIDKAVELLEKK